MAEKVSGAQVAGDIRQVQIGLGQMNEVCNGYQATLEAIKKSYMSLRMKVALKRLEEIPVEKLSIEGCTIRTASLKAAGFTNLRQIAAASKAQIDAVQGVGEETLKRIVARTVEIYKKTEQEVRVRLDRSFTDADRVVTLCYEAMLTEQEAVRMNQFAAALSSEPVEQRIREADMMTSAITFAFKKSQEKEAARRSYDWLVILLQAMKEDQLDAVYQSYVLHKNSCNSNEAWARFEQNTAPFYAVLERAVGSISLDENMTYGLTEELVKEIHAYPLELDLLKATLRNYQEFGTKYILHQKKCLLGDEMGLGKTMQAIAAMAHLKKQGMTHFLVVCPVSVLVNWGREMKEHSELQIGSIYGENRDQMFLDWVEQGNVAITTYETVTKLLENGTFRKDMELPKFMMTVDEAHYLKNPEAARTQSVMELTRKAEYALYMTGTPIENNVDEMIFLIRQLNEANADLISEIRELKDAPEFREKVSPVYLRRTREEVLSELPEKEETNEWCMMTSAEEKKYRSLLRDGSFMKLRQLSFLVDPSESSKVTRFLEIAKAAEEEHRKVIVFSYFTNTIEILKKLLKEKAYGPISGAVEPDERQKIVDDFSNGEDGSVLLCQIVAGGVGLNIQAASVVVIAEPQLKPSIENQAIARAYRMGQSRNVLVFRLLSDETVDERILELLKVKSEIFEKFADDSSVGEESMEMLEKESEQKLLAKIVQEEREKYDIPEDTE